jgi:uncharacterized membrane protein YeiB
MTQLAERIKIRELNTPRGRMLGIDLLRALAIIGMVWAHFSVASWLPEPDSAPMPSFSSGLTPWEWINTVVGIRPRDIFFVLAGVTVAIGTGGANRYLGRELLGSWRKLAVRAAFLFLLGLSMGVAGLGAVQILTFYGLWIVILMPLTALPARPLFWTAGVLAVVCPSVKILLNNANLFSPQMDEMRLLDEVSGFGIFVHPEAWGPFIQNLIFGSGSTTQDTIAILPFLVLGLALGRLDLRDRTIRVRLIVSGAAVSIAALVVGLISPLVFGSAQAYTDAQAGSAANDSPVANPQVPWQSLLSTANPGLANPLLSAVDCLMVSGLIVALLGAFLLLMERSAAKRILWPVVAFGSMSLTWYCLHLLVIGHTNPLGFIPTQSALSYLLFMAGALIISAVWRRVFSRGPLEWLQHVAVTRVTKRPEAPRYARQPQ